MGIKMETYYRDRAPEYDKFYDIPERQHDYTCLKSWLLEHARGRSVLEVAAGTGYWTQAAAAVAKAITATDLNPEMLTIAASRNLGSHVRLRAADAYALPEFPSTFDAGMAHMWWSHVGIERRQEFLSHFFSRLQPGAVILMIDQVFVEGRSPPVSRQDEWGNLFTLRTLSNGATYEIIKNYPSSKELHDSFGPLCEDIEVMRLPYFWALSARLRVRTLRYRV
jgi:demethylmenaquinone methyltransferase/2-methoxy-6-polyprenyl-1,4-benzoquinol methylase